MWKQIWEHLGQIFWVKFVRTIAWVWFRVFPGVSGFVAGTADTFLWWNQPTPGEQQLPPAFPSFFKYFPFFDHLSTNCTSPLHFLLHRMTCFPFTDVQCLNTFSSCLSSYVKPNTIELPRHSILQIFNSLNNSPLHFFEREQHVSLGDIGPIKGRALGPVATISVPLGNILLLFAAKSQIFHPLLWKLGEIRTHNKMH